VGRTTDSNSKIIIIGIHLILDDGEDFCFVSVIIINALAWYVPEKMVLEFFDIEWEAFECGSRALLFFIIR
jgi:hypothetical protein